MSQRNETSNTRKRMIIKDLLIKKLQRSFALNKKLHMISRRRVQFAKKIQAQKNREIDKIDNLCSKQSFLCFIVLIISFFKF